MHANVLNLKPPLSQAPKLPGLHLIGDLFECRCDSNRMLDAAWIEQHCLKLVEDAGLTAIAHVFHPFGDGSGVTGMVVLAESHLSLHTWPEEGFVTVDVYVCNYSSDNRNKARQLFDALLQTYAPQNPRTFSIDRV